MAKARQARNTRNTKSELARLRARLAEAEETLSAIRSGDVDAIAVDGPNGRQIFTLQSADQPYRILAERMNEGAATLTAEGTILFCNPRLAEMVGLPAERLLGSSVTSILEDGPQENFPKLVRQAFKKEVRVEASLVRNDGSLLPAQLSLSSIPLEESGPGICLVAIDLSAQKRSEEANLRLGSIVNSSDDGIISKTLDGMVTSWNAGAEQIYGYSAEEMAGQSISRLIPPDRLDEFNAIMTRIRQGQRVRHFETVRIRKGGQQTPMSLTVSPIKDGVGNVVGASTIARDITEQRQAEEKVRTAALYTRSLIEASLDPLVTISREGKITDVNQATEKVTGVSRDGLIGSDFSNYFTDPESARRGYEQVFAQGAVQDYPLAIRGETGEARDVLYNASVFRNEAGEVEGVFAAARDVTERKQAEQALNRSETRYRSLVTATAQIVWTTNPQGEVVDDMPMWRAFTGMSREQILGRGWMDSLHPDDRQRTAEIWDRAVRERSLYETEYRIRRHDGEYRMVAVRGVPVLDLDGSLRDWIGTCTDITDREAAEQALRQASLYTRSLIEASLDPLVTINREGKITDVNEATEKVTGARREQLVGSDFSNYFTDPESARRGYEQVFAQGAVQDYPLAIRSTVGKVTDVLYNATVFMDERGEVQGVFAAARDITERKCAEEALRSSEEQFRLLLNSTAEGILGLDTHGNCIFANPSSLRLFGYTDSSQIIGKNLHRQIRHSRCDGSPLAESECQVCQALQQRKPTHGDGEFFGRVDGSNFPAEYWAYPMYRDQEQVGAVIAIVDISERRRAVEELRLGRERLALAQKAGHSGTFDWDMVHNINLWSAELEEVHGLAPGEFGGRYEDWEALVLPEDLPAARAGIEGALRTGEFANEWRIRRGNDGQVRWITARAKIIFDNAGKPIRMIGLNMDITERKEAEEQVRKLNEELELRVQQRTAQLEAANKELEAFTYSVSHDLRAPLRHISGFSKILSEEFGPTLPGEAQHHLKRIEDGTRRMGILVDDLLNLARIGRRELSAQVSGLRSIVDEVIVELKPEYEGREIEWKISSLPFVECDPGLVKQVFQNLIANALKFTRPRPRAVIEIGQQEEDGGPAIYVRDNGVGFSMKYADKLFGVFQRLHRPEDFEGTGVGLATTQRIIQKHGGRIWAQAELDKGATFYFTLTNSVKNEIQMKAAAAGDKP